MSNDLELLHEGFKNEVDELESIRQQLDEYTLKAKHSKLNKQIYNLISNLEGLCDSLYNAFEEGDDTEHLKKENEIMRQWINERATDEDVLDFKLRHGMDVTDFN